MLKPMFVAAALLAAIPMTATAVLAQTAPAQGQATTGQGKVNKVDAKAKTVNLTHGPIAALKWPAMTMDFAVLPTVDLSQVKVGDTVNFTIGRAPDGMYAISGISSGR
jgi:Cu(I)/Ag(I) efflux system protein CusF